MSARYEFGPPVESTSVVSIYQGSRLGAHGFSKRVTLVVANPELSRERAFSKAFFEAGACFARLSNAKVLDVEEVVEERGRLFAVSPPLTGRSLARLVDCPPGRARAISPRFACRIVLLVAESVSETAEAMGERAWLGGVSAEAAWLTDRGEVQLLPTAMCAVHVPARCRKATAARYRAPELDRVKAGSPAADVYALGLLLWDLLSNGRGSTPRDLAEATCVANPAIDASLIALVMRCLSPRPGERPSDAAAFGAELVECMGAATPARPVVCGAALDAKVQGSTRPKARRDSSDGTVEIRTEELELVAPGATYDVAEPAVRHILDFQMKVRPPIPRPRSASERKSSAGNALGSHEPRLVVSGGSRLRLAGGRGRWVVGRGRSADLVAADPDMSREHFEVVRGTDGAFRVRDLGSKNGLYVNGSRTKTAILRSGDRLQAGGTLVRFER